MLMARLPASAACPAGNIPDHACRFMLQRISKDNGIFGMVSGARFAVGRRDHAGQWLVFPVASPAFQSKIFSKNQFKESKQGRMPFTQTATRLPSA
ncbi:hypothetical protein [Andreprevotia sp. IGB-42]|uniref:hypothetical protein n=1 Tax=Andreprevotia sp. IGB-42 TaxID=2497473 RepID=UPI001359456B|nr:hypothetical protein [Andreprevotia sp. IGB-42]